MLCELVEDDGSMMRGRRLVEFGAEHDIPLLSISELVTHRWATEAMVRREAEATLPTEYGEFRAVGFRSRLDGSEHIALVKGDVAGGRPCSLACTRSASPVTCSARSDAIAVLSCWQRWRRIADEGQGVIVYNRSHEGRGIGLLNKLSAYRLQDEGHDTVEANHALGFGADLRSFALEAQILSNLKVSSVRLMTNNPEKQRQLELYGIPVAERLSHVAGVGPFNVRYLETKRSKLGHMMGDAP